MEWMSQLGVKMKYVRISELSMDGEDQDHPMYDEYALRIDCDGRIVHIGGLDWEEMLSFNSTTIRDKLLSEGLNWVLEVIETRGYYTFMGEHVYTMVC